MWATPRGPVQDLAGLRHRDINHFATNHIIMSNLDDDNNEVKEKYLIKYQLHRKLIKKKLKAKNVKKHTKSLKENSWRPQLFPLGRHTSDEKMKLDVY